MLRCLILAFSLIVILIIILILRLANKKRERLKRVALVLLVLIGNNIWSDFFKTNFITYERNISEATINYIVESIETDEKAFYKKIEYFENTVVFSPRAFYDEYFKTGFLNKLYVDEYGQKVQVDLLYDEDNIKIYQSRVRYEGTFPLIPVEPSYYSCSVYILKDGEVTEISMDNETLLFFNPDKIIMQE